MFTWTRRIIVGVALLGGCVGKVDPLPPGSTVGGTGAGTGTGTGAGTGTGQGGTTGIIGGSVACMPGVPATSQMPRLTRLQYDNTIKELLGLDTQPSSMLAPDTTGSVDQRAWDGFQAAADSLSQQAILSAASKAKVIPCAPSGDGAACAKMMIDTFGKKAFRRPLTADESTRFNTLYANRMMLTAGGTFEQAAQMIVKAFLMSPSFLTKGETSESTPENGTFLLSGYEVASRLSYMLWNSMPDDALFSSAAAGKLNTSAGILTEAQRMLTDPRARAMVGAFHQTYAHMGDGTRWADYARDTTLYPKFTKEIIPMLSEETRRVFDYLTFDKKGTFKDLMTSPVAFVNATLAPIYGLTGSYGADYMMVNLDPATRAGVFTRAGFLAAYSLFNRPSPILRGAFLQKEVLCTTIAPPPPGVEGTPLPTTGATNRERVDQQTAAGECANCHHSVINPTGYTLENYDALGAYQANEAGMPVNAQADVLIDGKAVSVSGSTDLMNKIAVSAQAQNCYAKKWVETAYQRVLTAQDACTAQTLATKIGQDGYSVLSLVADLTQSQSFRYRAKE
jgi:Protein of unknown function (DUF1592)/Protein of unknown function (DUF1588)/Protein of unknown function (DUF1595)/Protein of unknown function (DUF1585)/Protein of unknown function (DUF1587)